MYKQLDRPKDNKSSLVAKTVIQNTNNTRQGFSFVDNRPKDVVQRKWSKIADNRPQSSQPKQLLQKKNNTGLPNNLKAGIENLSGYSMDDVKVHYNSSKPAQLQAHAYAQGSEVYLGPGQDKHLPHEAWHVVQQKQGRVKPTLQMKDKVNINDDAGLEKEADIMGIKALNGYLTDNRPVQRSITNGDVVQRAVGYEFQTNFGIEKYEKEHWYSRQKVKTPLDKTTLIAEQKRVDKNKPQHKIEADNSLKFDPQQVAEIEFIIDPPVPEGPGGADKLRSIMNALITDAYTLQGKAVASKGEPFELNIQGTNYLISPENKTQAIASIPQVTAGVRLDQLINLLNDDSEGPAQKIFASQRERIRQNVGEAQQIDSSDSLKGLLTIIIHYLQTWSGDEHRIGDYSYALEYAKDGIGLLARTNFAGMFEALPETDKAMFQTPMQWSQAVLALADMSGSEDQYVIQRGVRQPDLTREKDDYHPLGYGDVRYIGPKRGEWLEAMAASLVQEQEGQDLLSGDEELQSMGALGRKHDSVGLDAALEGAIIEFRKAQSPLPVDEWMEFAMSIFHYLSEINARQPIQPLPVEDSSSDDEDDQAGKAEADDQ